MQNINYIITQKAYSKRRMCFQHVYVKKHMYFRNTFKT